MCPLFLRKAAQPPRCPRHRGEKGSQKLLGVFETVVERFNTVNIRKPVFKYHLNCKKFLIFTSLDRFGIKNGGQSILEPDPKIV
jgi:hypothetical protein